MNGDFQQQSLFCVVLCVERTLYLPPLAASVERELQHASLYLLHNQDQISRYFSVFGRWHQMSDVLVWYMQFGTILFWVLWTVLLEGRSSSRCLSRLRQISGCHFHWKDDFLSRMHEMQAFRRILKYKLTSEAITVICITHWNKRFQFVTVKYFDRLQLRLL